MRAHISLFTLVGSLMIASCHAGQKDRENDTLAPMSASRPTIHQNLLPWQDKLDARDVSAINLIVIHCTELPDLEMARQYGEQVHYPQSGTGNSGHFYIDRHGRIEQYVNDDRIAHHVRGHNEHSIGIELVNRGRYPDWHHSNNQHMTEPYPDEQIEALIELMRWLIDRHEGINTVAGHEELDTAMMPAADDPEKQVRRKMDPGPLFPWDQVLSKSGLTRIGLP